MISRERAEEILKECQKESKETIFTSQLNKLLTQDECREVNSMWLKMPGPTSFVDAFLKFLT